VVRAPGAAEGWPQLLAGSQEGAEGHQRGAAGEGRGGHVMLCCSLRHVLTSVFCDCRRPRAAQSAAVQAQVAQMYMDCLNNLSLCHLSLVPPDYFKARSVDRQPRSNIYWSANPLFLSLSLSFSLSLSLCQRGRHPGAGVRPEEREESSARRAVQSVSARLRRDARV
jgi:hypothetical protein